MQNQLSANTYEAVEAAKLSGKLIGPSKNGLTAETYTAQEDDKIKSAKKPLETNTPGVYYSHTRLSGSPE